MASTEPCTSPLTSSGELLGAGRLQIGHHLLEAAAGAGDGQALAPLAHAIIGDLPRAGFVLDHGELIARLGRAIEAQHLDRNRGAGARHLLAELVDQRAHAAIGRAGDDEVADVQRAALNQRRADRPAAALELGFDDHAFRGAVRIGGQLQHFGLKRDRLQQLVEAGPLQRRDLDLQRIAAEALDHDLVAEQLGADALRIGALFVDLVDGDDHRHAGGLGVIDGLDRLRLHAVIGRHHQHDDVGHLSATLPHGGEGLVAGRIDESDLVAERRHNLIGADMLGDAACFLRNDIGRADGVEQRGLAVVDMAHDGDDRRARLQILGVILGADEAFLDVGFRDAPHRVAELLGHQLGGVGVDHVVDLMHRAVLHQIFDDVDAALGHAVGELLDGDDLGDHDLALDLRLRLRAGDLLFLALLAALQRGKAPLALLLVERVDDGEPAAHPSLLAATRRGDALLVPGIGGAGGLLGLLLGQVLAARSLRRPCAPWPRPDAARLLCAYALRASFALLGPLIFGHDVQRRRLLGLLALRRIALARVGERAHARVLLLLGELRQHDASLARRRIVLNGLLHGLGGARGRLGRRRLLDGLRRTTRADRAALLLLDQHGLRAAMAEALAHMAGFHRPAHVEGHFAPAASGLVFSLVGLTHSLSVSDPFWLANVLLPLR